MQQESQIKFVVTGFGPFNGVPRNPTTVLVEKLVDFLRQDTDTNSRRLAESTEAIVLETSVEDVERQIDRIHSKIVAGNKGSNEPTVTILLHLGVNHIAEQFQIEAQAYNTCDFRISDERGYQPRNQRVSSSYELEAVYETALDVDDLLRSVSSNMATTECTSGVVALSTDPGRFVCNYTYCYSMDKFCCSKSIGGNDPPSISNSVRSLFLHVPPFSAINEAEQQLFLRNIMIALDRQVSTQMLSTQDVKAMGGQR
mmetsp:Transcript_24822/g.68748  ORF Transcript_24822/g.68748 Transcript_24822/m.68748 type:complete len:256 (+) Transcript_24822:256-1023(+)|eukprot:CAMPEP_0168771408 /NCGR_PEP_ID=MMETSP0725-20121227/3423_1 /TAXON_ID=265536 /ORGANISM="Amphiprora sp., Strain CCMP467" /LENGTH=255 /DNA_ID=CAMNT_0008820889 /DNA_START=179 /DNA_END=946 /DNA_ORIENTATION=+